MERSIRKFKNWKHRNPKSWIHIKWIIGIVIVIAIMQYTQSNVPIQNK